MRLIAHALLLFACAGGAQAEYCLDWSSFVAKHSGSSGHCWPSERECNSYRMSRPSGDYVGGCYYRPGQYPRTGEQKAGGKASAAGDAAAKATAEQQKKLEAMKREQAESERQAFEKERQQLLGVVKGAAPSEPARTITLKPLPPPAAGTARSQLDCVSRNSPGAGWEQKAPDCAPVTPDVPAPSKPVAAEQPPQKPQSEH